MIFTVTLGCFIILALCYVILASISKVEFRICIWWWLAFNIYKKSIETQFFGYHRASYVICNLKISRTGILYIKTLVINNVWVIAIAYMRLPFLFSSQRTYYASQRNVTALSCNDSMFFGSNCWNICKFIYKCLSLFNTKFW